MFEEIEPIVVDEEGCVVDGFHRKAAGWQSAKAIALGELAKKLGVSREAAKIIYRINKHTRHEAEGGERRSQFIALAEELKKQGVEPGKISERIADVSGFTVRYVHGLLSSPYKRRYAPQKRGVVADLMEDQSGPAACPYCGSRITAAKDFSLHVRWLRDDRVLEERMDAYRKLIKERKPKTTAGPLVSYLGEANAKMVVENAKK
jgi:hypothetical protein